MVDRGIFSDLAPKVQSELPAGLARGAASASIDRAIDRARELLVLCERDWPVEVHPLGGPRRLAGQGPLEPGHVARRRMMRSMSAPDRFRYLFRIRYQECDAQKIAFNARWGEYVDLASAEYTRALFGSVDPEVSGIDWRLVRQTIEWKAPGRYDDVIEAQVHTVRVGTTSFTLATRFVRWPEGAPLVTAETVYVATDPVHGTKQPVSDAHRRKFEAGAPGVQVDHAGALD